MKLITMLIHLPGLKPRKNLSEVKFAFCRLTEQQGNYLAQTKLDNPQVHAHSYYLLSIELRSAQH